MLGVTRRFFEERGVLEVETPSIVSHAVTERHLRNVECHLHVGTRARHFLHTSPEFHMKRLLADGAPDIYQICKVYRDGELGTKHLPEFTLIEWYRHAFDRSQMIGDACDLISRIAGVAGKFVLSAETVRYAELFLHETGIDVRHDSAQCVRKRTLELMGPSPAEKLQPDDPTDRDFWLDLLMGEIIQPRLATRGLVVVDRYPASQAALARLSPEDPNEAERFEIFLDGIELANGYHELCDAEEQRRRFEADRVWRRNARLDEAPHDPAMLAALAHGLPDCSGCALGFDRLVMAALGIPAIRNAVAFMPSDLQADD
jgi:lysyl-tRNA synthetase class 2